MLSSVPYCFPCCTENVLYSVSKTEVHTKLDFSYTLMQYILTYSTYIGFLTYIITHILSFSHMYLLTFVFLYILFKSMLSSYILKIVQYSGQN